MANEISFCILALAASILTGAFGFGASLVILTFGTLLLPVREVIVLSTLYFTVSNINSLLLYRKDILWRLTGLITLASVPTTFIGAELMVHASPEMLKRAMGAMILIYVANSYFGWTKSVNLNSAGILAAGAVYGFLSGAVATGNVVKAALLDQMRIEKRGFVATMASTALISNTIKISVYGMSGVVSKDMMPMAACLAVSATVGVWFGRRWLSAMSPGQFRLGTMILLSVVSVQLLIF